MIYLDNAATSFPKPPNVLTEVARCMNEYCGNPGRGGHPLAIAAAEKIYDCRVSLSNLFSCPEPEYVVFTQNATVALNLAILGAAKDGAHFLASDCEHNSVRRPLEYLVRERGCSYTLFPAFPGDPRRSPSKILKVIRESVRPETVALICTACPNICSAQMPLEEIGLLCHRLGIFFIVDAAQGAGHFPINMKDANIDALALPGHKGLWGPQGSGALLLGNDFTPSPLIRGGSGSASLDPEMPRELPERLEAGTLSTPAIAGLHASIETLEGIGLDNIASHERKLFYHARSMISSIRGVTLYAPYSPGSVLSFNIDGLTSDKVAAALSERGICVRGGFHCAPWAHASLGTGTGGCVRVSFSYFNTTDDIAALYDALREISKGI